MSEAKHPVDPPAPAASSVPKQAPKLNLGYSNVAFQMMGIPRLKLPSRNWMIFWSVLATFGGGAAYDKYQQRQLRSKYMADVSKFGDEPMSINVTSRKLTVFIAPPPSDFLQESLAIFKKYVKPILNSAAIDFDLVTEQQQGEIRYKVAEDIRNLRRKYRNEAPVQSLKDQESVSSTTSGTEEDEFIRPTSVYHWSDNSKSSLNNKIFNEDGTVVETKLSKTLSPLSVLGINYHSNLEKDIPALHSEDELVETPEQAGGVICIGRGAYIEYLTGLNEGLLGPLEAPVIVEDVEPVEKLQEEDVKDAKDDQQKDEGSDETDKPLAKIPLPYITPKDYSKAELASELNLNEQLFFSEHKPVYFQQPILVLRTFNLVGFLKIPERIYRFYQKRNQLEFYHQKTMAVVDKKYRSFDKSKDLDLAKDEELDWPSKWVNKAKDKDSLWVSQLLCDDRVAQHLYVYDDE